MRRSTPSPPTNPPEPSHCHDDHLEVQWDDPEAMWCEDNRLYVERYCTYTTHYEAGNERVGPFTEHCGHTGTIAYDPHPNPSRAPVCPAMVFEHDDPANTTWNSDGEIIYEWGDTTNDSNNGWIRCDPDPITAVDAAIGSQPSTVTVEGECRHCGYDVSVTYKRP